jgi:hypothetical protein
MGWLWFESWGKEDASIVEEIAKVHKYNIKTVAKYYREMLGKIEKELKEYED